MIRNLSKYQPIFFITVFLTCIINVYVIAFSPVVSDIHPEKYGFKSTNGQELVLKAEDFISLSSGLKVETIVISSPVSFDTFDNHLSNPNHLISLYLKKKYSLISHNKHIISKTLNLSPLITKLQI